MLAFRLAWLISPRKLLRQAVVGVVPDPIFTAAKRLRSKRAEDIDVNSASRQSNAQELFGILKDAGAILSFGSLLGVVREGRFLAHDDDLDYIYEGDLRRLRTLLESKAHGRWEVRDRGRFLMKVILRDSGLRVDVFRGFRTTDRMHVATIACGREVALYFFDRALLMPPTVRNYECGSFLVPREPEKFLASHYGSGWQVYDPTWTYSNAPSRVTLANLRRVECQD